MPKLRFPFLSLIAVSGLLTLSACEKDFATAESSDTEVTPTVSTEECPSLGAHLAEADAEQESDHTQLLQYFTEAQLADLRANACLAKEAPVPGEGLDERASGLKNRFWTPGATIRVRFLNGSAALQQKVFSWAQEWENYANVHFTKVGSGASEVRILFGEDGHWSYIGTDNAGIEACDETMALELKDATSASEVRRVSLHEFGHVLGMRHEHQQPLATIPWNTSAVYTYYEQQDWTKAEVDQQVLNKTTAESSQHTNFDASSVMEYPVPASLTTNGFSIGWNTQLSSADKSFIGLMYSSQRMRIRHAASGYNSNITFQLAGIHHTVKPGETMSVPALTGTNALSIYEQPSGTWVWDNAYAPVYGKHYKLVRVGTSNNLTLQAE